MNAHFAEILLKKFLSLPPKQQTEVEDFIDFLRERACGDQLVRSAAHISEPALRAGWGNPGDSAHDSSRVTTRMGHMDFTSVEQQALSLPADERARLVQGLLESLDRLTPDEVQRLWLDEAGRRAVQIDRGETTLVPANVVAKKARALLK
jgi:Putative addiction module component